MKITNELIEAMIELAVVKAMNLGAYAFGIPRPAGGTDAVKAELKKFITADALDNGTVILTLDSMQADMVGPLYCVFSASWSQVQQEVVKRLHQAPVFQGVTFDVLLRVM